MIEVEVSPGIYKRAADNPGNFNIKKVDYIDYTILDDDGYDAILVTTGTGNKTITLPTAENNIGRKILILKIDSDSGMVIIDGEGVEQIRTGGEVYGNTIELLNKHDMVSLLCDGIQWWATIYDKLSTKFYSYVGDIPFARNSEFYTSWIYMYNSNYYWDGSSSSVKYGIIPVLLPEKSIVTKMSIYMKAGASHNFSQSIILGIIIL